MGLVVEVQVSLGFPRAGPHHGRSDGGGERDVVVECV